MNKILALAIVLLSCWQGSGNLADYGRKKVSSLLAVYMAASKDDFSRRLVNL